MYSIPEASNHWFNMYYSYYVQKLQIDQSTYDLCLLYTNSNSHRVVGLQTDNTLFLADDTFASAEETRLQEAKFLAKPQEQLTTLTLIKFNSG